MTNKIIPVILSGGSGTRLWPLSRKQYPKQYLPLVGGNTMLQETILRLKGINKLADPVVICSHHHRFLVADQLQQINIHNPTILLEPVGRNTAPAIAASALYVALDDENKDAVLLILPADHVIQKIEVFHEAINNAIIQAQAGSLVTLGIVPTYPNTAYGYIQKGKPIDKGFKVNNFIEKPDQQTANSFFEAGNYLWNSGIFIFTIESLMNGLATYSVEILQSVKKSVDNATQDLDFIRLEESSFKSSPSDSIDYALMEKSNNVMVVPLDANWSDVGSWSALYDIGAKDNTGNVVNGDVLIQDTHNSYIYAEHHLVTTIGVQDLIIVDTPDAILIAGKHKAHTVNEMVKTLQQQEREEQFCHRKVYRPWGWYDSIEKGAHFQVKRLHISPGAKLSLQMHHKRAEHWVVVQGVATATCGEDVLTLTEGQSIYIPISVKHALENLENTPLEIIEVQSGAYLGEDDIVRFEDIYGRVQQ